MKKYFVILLIVIFLLAGCSKSVQKQNPSMTEDLKTIYQSQGEYDTLVDFENSQEIKLSAVFENQFGKTTVNKDPKFITHGEASARIEIYGDNNNITQMYPTIEFILDREPILKTDLTLYKSVDLDVFNSSDRDINIYSSMGSFTKKLYSNAVEFVLPKDEWTHIVLQLPKYADEKIVPVSQLTSVYFWFDIPQKNETKPILYFDYLAANKKEMKQNETENQANEIAFFESQSQIDDIISSGAFVYRSNPMLTKNTNTNFTTQGKNSLKIKALIPFKGVTVYKGYPLLSFRKERFKSIGDINSSGGFSIDIYNNTSERRLISVNVYDEKNKVRSFYNIILDKERWTNFSATINEIKQYDIDVAKISKIDFYWEESGNYSQNLELYFDNFKLGGDYNE